MMMRRRMIGPRVGMGVVGAAATTAAVVGTAGAVRHAQSNRWERKEQEQYAQQQSQQEAATVAQQQEQIDQMQQQMATMQAQQAQAAPPAAAAPAPAPAAAAPAPGSDLTAQLHQLGELKASGVLTDEEFAAAKAKLLSGG